MSNFSSSKFYPEYKKYLNQFSVCIKPVLRANYERMIQDLPDVAAPLDRYCVAERVKLQEFRNLIKEEFNQV